LLRNWDFGMSLDSPRKHAKPRSIYYALLILALPASTLRLDFPRHPTVGSRVSAAQTDAENCPTGKPCGVTAPYCQDYSPPSTKGATIIRSLPYRITSSGRYFLNEDLTSSAIGIAVLADNVDINLNGRTLTYGATPSGTGVPSVGEYGVLACNTGNLASENLDASYATNGFCRSGGISARNVTIENGNIVQSPNASQFHDPSNCPGSGVAGGCAHHHESAASDIISAQYTSGLTVSHVTMTWQNADSDGIHMAWQLAGPGHRLECNAFHDKVTEINNRAYQRGTPISGQNDRLADHGDVVRYNSLTGSPQSGIVIEAPRSDISFNDINQGYYQFPPFTNQGRMYSNDYAIGACVRGGTIAYNYIHSVSGRGIGCIFGGDMAGMKVHHNYVKTIEQDANAEYGPNGAKPGAPWIGGCEINGGRGFESKESPNIQIYSNTFILSANRCGAAALVFVGFPCREAKCPSSLDPFIIRDNTIQLQNVAALKQQPYAQAFACFLFEDSQGNYDNYFSPIAGNRCITDGDFVTTEGYGPGNYFIFEKNVFSRGEHPLSSGCGGAAQSPCGFLMHWHGQEGPAPNELGFVFRDMLFNNGAKPSFFGDGGTPLARSARVEWTYGIAVVRSDNAAPIRGATVSAVDSRGENVQCATDESGQCSVSLVQTEVSSQAGNATLRTENRNPQKFTITAEGCRSLTYEVEVKNPLAERKSMDCSAASVH
jgi:hypothetical protein